jgi:hypothetical protein
VPAAAVVQSPSKNNAQGAKPWQSFMDEAQLSRTNHLFQLLADNIQFDSISLA